MAYGIEITAQNGKVYATPETPFMHMTSRFDIGYSGHHLGNQSIRHNTGISAGARMIHYARQFNGEGYHWAEPYQSGGTWWLNVWVSGNFSVRYYIFTNQIPPSSGGYGIELYAANGTRVYSTSTMPLQNHVGTLPHADRNGRIRPGFVPAAIPLPMDFWVQPIGGGRDVQFMVASPVCSGTEIKLGVTGTGIMPSSSGFSFSSFGGAVNYINAPLYD